MNRDKAITIVLLLVGLSGCNPGQGTIIPELDIGEMSVNQPMGEPAPHRKTKSCLCDKRGVDLVNCDPLLVHHFRGANDL